MLRQIVLAFLIASVVPWFAGCITEPVTGRKQIAFAMNPEEETQLGAQAYQETLKEAKISSDAVNTAILQRVGQSIATVANQPDFKWEFTLIESPEVNAFCLPGGKVAVYTGILPVCKNEAGLAAVIGHEVGHAIAHHGNERMSQAKLVEIGAQALQAGTGKMSAGAQTGLLLAYGAGAKVGYELPFSRTQEKSADDIGLNLMAKAGYDPSEAVHVWERMAAQEGGASSGIMKFLSTHPPTQARIEDLKSRLPQEQQTYQSAAKKLGLGEPLHAQ